VQLGSLDVARGVRSPGMLRQNNLGLSGPRTGEQPGDEAEHRQ
jgi:hypothetical protein